jgi:hypothetical protein
VEEATTKKGLAAFLVLAWRAPEMMLQGHLSTEVIGVYSEPWSGILMLLTKQTTIVLAVAVFLLHPLRAGETSGPTHRVSFSGEVAKLMRECGVEITSSLSQKKPAFAGKVSDFPVELRAAEFGAAMVDVTDSSGARVLAILLDRPLFRDDTDCNLCLDKPTCETSVRRSGTALRIHHWAWIAEKICYADMPYWDSHQEKLTCADAPFLKITSAKSPTPVVFSGKMVKGCGGYGWLAFPHLPPDVKRGDILSITVTHQTGDLWGPISTTAIYRVE